jgi:RND family efflux transporter MFP subunit
VLRILVSVPQAFAPQIRPGLTTSLLVREYPGQVFQGTVFYIAGALDTASRTLLTEIHVSNQQGVLLPGMYTEVEFNLPARRPVIHIPANALIVDAQGTHVAVVGQNNRLHFQPVRLGRDFGTDIEVLEGLSGQEHLVSNPTDDLTEGEAVHPITPQAGKPAHGGAGGGGGSAR